ncbi:MAG: UDP-N-acetylglucosamine 2-epimerase (non-hydrolyzing) [Deltaproteobacteria bacterium]|nr:MAG: UDP-N-acetylglucosamine 2-epimerase (non-hydrolyzing) [Deltaproteobacteria bacterium]
MFSPVIRALIKGRVDFFMIHSGQHYSYNMDEILFEELEIPKPSHYLTGVAEKKLHGAQTAVMLEGIERVLIQERPAILLVGGDTNTNLAGALAARKLHIAIGHIESGERSYDWRIPEEHNRRMIDHISEYLFVTNEKGNNQLLKENVMGRTFIVGNTIVDAAFQNIELAKKKSAILEKHGLQEKKYIVLTAHREENVDHEETLANILNALELMHQRTGLPIFFSAHPRTLNRLKIFQLTERAGRIPGLIISEALGYLDFLRLLSGARLALTDSGGVQQEACIFQVPCVTLREVTEWTETLEIGANILAGVAPEKIVAAGLEMLQRDGGWPIPFGDGAAAQRIVAVVKEELGRLAGKPASAA